MAFKLAELFAEITAKDVSFKEAIERSHEHLHGLNEHVLKFNETMTKVFLAGSAMIAGTSYKFAEAEKVMARLRIVTQTTAEEFEKLKEAAEEATAGTTHTAVEAAQAMMELSRNGIEVTDIIKLLPNVIRLAAAAETDMITASKSLSQTMKGLGLDMKDAAKVTDLMAKASITAVDIGEIGNALRRVGGTARAAGVDLGQLTALLITLHQSGVPGQESGMALRSFLRALTSTSPKIKEKMKELVGDVQKDGKLLDLSEIVARLAASMDKFDEQTKLGLAFQLFGRGAESVLKLIGDGGEKLKENQEKMKNWAGASQNALSIMTETLSFQFQRLRVAVDELAVKIGSHFAPVMREIIKIFNEGVEWVMKFNESIYASMAKWAALSVAIAGIVTMGAFLYGTLQGLITPMVAIVSVLAILGAKLLDTVIAGDTLEEKFASLKEGIQKMVDAARPYWDTLVQDVLFGMAIWNNAIRNTQDYLDMFALKIGAVCTLIQDVWTYTWTEVIPSVINYAIDVVKTEFEFMEKTATALFYKMKQIVAITGNAEEQKQAKDQFEHARHEMNWAKSEADATRQGGLGLKGFKESPELTAMRKAYQDLQGKVHNDEDKEFFKLLDQFMRRNILPPEEQKKYAVSTDAEFRKKEKREAEKQSGLAMTKPETTAIADMSKKIQDMILTSDAAKVGDRQLSELEKHTTLLTDLNKAMENVQPGVQVGA